MKARRPPFRNRDAESRRAAQASVARKKRLPTLSPSEPAPPPADAPQRAAEAMPVGRTVGMTYSSEAYWAARRMSLYEQPSQRLPLLPVGVQDTPPATSTLTEPAAGQWQGEQALPTATASEAPPTVPPSAGETAASALPDPTGIEGAAATAADETFTRNVSVGLQGAAATFAVDSGGLTTGHNGSGARLPLQASATLAGTSTLTLTNKAAVDIALDTSEPFVLAVAKRVIAEIEKQATGLRVRILEAGPTSLRVEVHDELRRQPAEFEAEIRQLRVRLQSAAREIQEYKGMLLAKEQEIDRLIVRIARGATEPDRESLASILYCDVEGSATFEPQKKESLLRLLWQAGAILANPQKHYMCNSWGDAVLFAFEDPNDALRGAFGLIKTLEAQGCRARTALTYGRVKLQHNPMRASLDIIAGSVDEAARLEPAMKRLDDVSVLVSEDFRNHHQLDEVAFGFEERSVSLEKPFGQRRAGERLLCYKAIDKRNI